MQQPPDSYDPRFTQNTQPGNGHSPSYPGQFSSAQQAPFHQNIPPSNYWNQNLHQVHQTPFQIPLNVPKSLPRLRTSRTQKFFITFAFLITTALVLFSPFYLLQQYFFPYPIARQPQPIPPAVSHALALLNTPVSGPLGTPILPLATKIMTGVSVSGTFDTVDQFEKDAGKKASVLFLYQAWGNSYGAEFPVDWANTVRQRGSLPMITWLPWVDKSYPESNNEPDYALKNIISGKFDTYITRWAKEAKGWKRPLFLRFAPEMNGNWVPWAEGLNGNKVGEYVQAWKHVHDIFTTVGATNVTWIWCPNINFYESTSVAELYPGDTYVDWIGLDGFNWGTTTQGSKWSKFSQVFLPTYSQITKMTQKPIILAETGSVGQGGNKADWVTNAYSVAQSKYFPNVKAIAWFNQVTQEDWRIESSPDVQAAFASAIEMPVYASNSFSNYMGG
ncbi:MAG: glycosyl hydrolase [Ktedonobacteraceae bacterium]